MYRPSVEIKTIAPAELPPLITAIENVMREAQRITQNAADEHWRAFVQQMRDKFGTDEIVLDEPYLPETIAYSSLKFLIQLQRLVEKIQSGAEDEDFRTSIFDFDEPVMPQLTQRLELETARHQLAAKQELDKTRQQSFGVKKFVWHASGEACPICAPLDGLVFSWEDGTAPGDTHPNCQCWTEPLADDAGDKPVLSDDDKRLLAEIAALLAVLIASRGRLAPVIGRRVVRDLGEAGRRILRRVENEEPAPTQPKPQEKPPEKPPAQPKPDVFERPKGVPKDWKASPTKNGDGVVYTDPKNPGTYVKVQKGNPNSSQPGQRYDNVRIQKNGQSYDVNGNKVPQQTRESHIPLEDFKFPEGLFR